MSSWCNSCNWLLCKQMSWWSRNNPCNWDFFLESCYNFIDCSSNICYILYSWQLYILVTALTLLHLFHSHSCSQKRELCTECGTSKMVGGPVEHSVQCSTFPPIDNSVQLNDRKRRLFYHLGSMVFCNKWLYHLELSPFFHLLIVRFWHIAVGSY